MPVVINELVFEAEIQGPSRRGAAKGSGGGELSRRELEAVVEACVEEVMRALERKRER